MALSAVNLASASASGSEVQTVTTSAFTPVSNTRLVIYARGDSATTGVDLSITSNTGGLTLGAPDYQFTQQSADLAFNRIAAWFPAIGTSPGSMTVTIDAGASTKTAWITYGVVYVTDGTGTAPQLKAGQVIGSNADNAGGATETITSGTLPTAATSGNVTLFLIGRNNDNAGTATAPATFSALHDTGAIQFESVVAFSSTTFTGVSTTCTDLGTTIENSNSILAEFEAGTSSSVNPFAPRWDYRSPVLRM